MKDIRIPYTRNNDKDIDYTDNLTKVKLQNDCSFANKLEFTIFLMTRYLAFIDLSTYFKINTKHG